MGTVRVYPEVLGLGALYKRCNSLIVQLMFTSETALSAGVIKPKRALLFASEKVCVGYLQLHHFLVSILNAHPELRANELERLQRFRTTLVRE